MFARRVVVTATLILVFLTALHAQRRFGGQRPWWYDQDDYVATPADAGEKTEFYFTRLKYSSYGRPPDMYWAMRGNWTIDYPKADRTFVQGVRRLTRIHVRSMEHVVDMEGEDIYNYPFIYVVEPGHWELTDKQAARLRDYLDRGGFLMTDDFHGTFEWEIFMASLKKVFPERPVVDIEDSDPIFHVLYDLGKRTRVPGVATFGSGRDYEYDGVEPKWRGVYDDKGRLVMGICHNMDLGDAWEWADNPNYPEHYASQAYRIGINYIMYSMTH